MKSWNTRIQAVGVELEGAWSDERRASALAYFNQHDLTSDNRFVRDGSVYCREHPMEWYRGEIPSKPFTEPGDLKEFLVACWPSGVPTKWIEDDSCGLHIHISLRTRKQYQYLMCAQFFNDVMAFWKDWASDKNFPANHPIWQRVRGTARFCRAIYDAARQVEFQGKAAAGSSRWTALNYCYGMHGTLELRVLPMFQKWKEGFEAVQVWTAFVENWLKNYHEQAFPWEAKVEVPLEENLIEALSGQADIADAHMARHRIITAETLSLGNFEEEVLLCV